MQSWIKSLFGSGGLTELPEELTQLLAEAKRERTALRDLLKRSETASKKFEGLADPLEAMRATAECLNSQMSELQARVDSFEGAASTIDAVAVRAIDLAESQAAHASSSEEAGRMISELTTKVSGIEKAIMDLLAPKGGVTRVRAEVAELMVDVSRLEVRANAFAQIEGRIAAIGEQAGELEADQKSMARSFESVSKRLAETHATVSELGNGLQSVELVKQELEDLAGPNGSLTKIRAQVEKAREKSLDYGQEVARIREDQADVRAAQEGVVSRYEELRSNMESQIEKADVRLARAAALLREIRASLESLISQKVVVDRVIATSGRLSFQAKEAEGLINALREERELTQGIHDALTELRQEDSDTVHLEFRREEA